MPGITLSRRQLLVAPALTALTGRPARADEPLDLPTGPHLLLDDYLIARSTNLQREIRRCERTLAGPIVTGAEGKNFQPYVTVIRDPESRRFRMWYNASRDGKDAGLGYRESADGIHWPAPHRDLDPPAGAEFRYGASVVDDGPRFRDPGQRYKLAWWFHGGLTIATSPDGYAWKLISPDAVLKHDHDINSLHWDPIRKRYLALVSTYITGPKWSGRRRCSMVSSSPDLVHWSDPNFAFTPEDGPDPGETQFYCMSGVIARGGLLIGLLKVLRDELPADEGGPKAGLGYTVLGWSRDGRTWFRDREPFLERGPVGSWDHAMSWGDCQLPVEDEVFLYYGGYRRGHKIDRFTERQLGLVRFPRDRYVARTAGAETGSLITPLLRIQGHGLRLNADAGAGEVTAELRDAEDRSIPGFRFKDCRPIRADGLDQDLRWDRSLDRLKGRPARLELRLRRAKLYAIEVV